MELYADIVRGLPATFLITFLALLIGALGAIPILIVRKSRFRACRAVLRVLIDIVRALPPIVWLFIVFFGLPEVGLSLEPFPSAVLALSLISSAYLSEIFRGGLLAVDAGQAEAAHVLGVEGPDLYRFVLGPQAFRVALPSTTTYSIGLLKDTSLAYTIGVNEVLFRANYHLQSGEGSAILILGFVGMVYASLSIPTGILSRRLDAALQQKVSR